MKRALAIPVGLSLFGIAVASFTATRPTARQPAPVQTASVSSASVQVAAADDYFPPLLGIYDDQEAAVPGAIAQLTSFVEEAPRPLPAEFLHQIDWPAARPDRLLQVGYDNPLPLPMAPTPKVGSANTSILIPDLGEPLGSSGANIPPAMTSTPLMGSSPPKISESLIRPKPLTMETSTRLTRVQPGEPPLAGNQPLPMPAGQPQAVPAPIPAAAPLQPTPAGNLSEFTGCGCQPKIGPSCGGCAQVVSSCGSPCVYETPVCCRSFSSCCQSTCGGCQIVEYPVCCGGESKWRPFSKIRGWLRGDQYNCCGSFEEACFGGCCSPRKPLFSRFRGLFQKKSDDCVIYESCETGCPISSCCGQ